MDMVMLFLVDLKSSIYKFTCFVSHCKQNAFHHIRLVLTQFFSRLRGVAVHPHPSCFRPSNYSVELVDSPTGTGQQPFSSELKPKIRKQVYNCRLFVWQRQAMSSLGQAKLLLSAASSKKDDADDGAANLSSDQAINPLHAELHILIFHLQA